jgi:hypothetical protein
VRRIVLAIVWTLVASGCARTAEQSNEAASATPADTAVIQSVPKGPCAWATSVPKPESTFVLDDRLYGADADGSHVRCLVDNVYAKGLSWGPAADRVLFGGLDGIRKTGARTPKRDDESAADVAISHPAGKSIIYTSPDGAHLYKVRYAGGPREDISFLKRHDEVVYHPAGTHVAVVGIGDNEGKPEYGIWQATNVGRDAKPLAIAETAKHISSLTYGNDGTLYFAADHGGRFHIHAFRQDGGGLEVLATTTQPVGNLVASPFADASRELAYREGDCDGQFRTRIIHPKAGKRDAIADARPLGWLTRDALLVVRGASACKGSGDLLVWTPDRTTLLVNAVDLGAVRTAWPAPPQPPPTQAKPPEA